MIRYKKRVKFVQTNWKKGAKQPSTLLQSFHLIASKALNPVSSVCPNVSLHNRTEFRAFLGAPSCFHSFADPGKYPSGIHGSALHQLKMYHEERHEYEHAHTRMHHSAQGRKQHKGRRHASAYCRSSSLCTLFQQWDKISKTIQIMIKSPLHWNKCKTWTSYITKLISPHPFILPTYRQTHLTTRENVIPLLKNTIPENLAVAALVGHRHTLIRHHVLVGSSV